MYIYKPKNTNNEFKKRWTSAIGLQLWEYLYNTTYQIYIYIYMCVCKIYIYIHIQFNYIRPSLWPTPTPNPRPATMEAGLTSGGMPASQRWNQNSPSYQFSEDKMWVQIHFGIIRYLFYTDFGTSPSYKFTVPKKLLGFGFPDRPGVLKKNHEMSRHVIDLIMAQSGHQHWNDSKG